MYTPLLLLLLVYRHYLYCISRYCIWVSHDLVWCSTCINSTLVCQSSTGCTISESFNAHVGVSSLCNAVWTVRVSSTCGQLWSSLLRQATEQKLKEGDDCGRTRRRSEDNIEMDLKEISWEDVDWVHVAKDSDNLWAVTNMVVKFRVP